nr:hypothetical protein [Desulfopila sp. IMCC35006]
MPHYRLQGRQVMPGNCRRRAERMSQQVMIDTLLRYYAERP